MRREEVSVVGPLVRVTVGSPRVVGDVGVPGGLVDDSRRPDRSPRGGVGCGIDVRENPFPRVGSGLLGSGTGTTPTSSLH